MVAENLVDIYTPDSRIYDWFIGDYPAEQAEGDVYSIFGVPAFNALRTLERFRTEAYEVRDSENGNFIQVRLRRRIVLGDREIREFLETL